MRLFGEISENLLGGITPCGRCLFFVGGGGYFQGVKTFDGFSDRGVTLRFSEGNLKVSGERLRVAKYRGEDLELKGTILSVEYSAKREEKKPGEEKGGKEKTAEKETEKTTGWRK